MGTTMWTTDRNEKDEHASRRKMRLRSVILGAPASVGGLAVVGSRSASSCERLQSV